MPVQQRRTDGVDDPYACAAPPRRRPAKSRRRGSGRRSPSSRPRRPARPRARPLDIGDGDAPERRRRRRSPRAPADRPARRRSPGRWRAMLDVVDRARRVGEEQELEVDGGGPARPIAAGPPVRGRAATGQQEHEQRGPRSIAPLRHTPSMPRRRGAEQAGPSVPTPVLTQPRRSCPRRARRGYGSDASGGAGRMSRAFVKEDDGSRPEVLPELPVSSAAEPRHRARACG